MSALFTVGIVTYDRLDFLVECVNSVIKQSFDEFEILISNDFVEKEISFDDIGIYDDRIKIINQKINLGPWRNHNFLVGESETKYFCWLSDDDIMERNFLEIMKDVIDSCENPRRIFCGYHSDHQFNEERSVSACKAFIHMSGREFVKSYLNFDLETVGHYGVFDREYLLSLGGLENIGSGVYSPYNDNLLGIKSGNIDEVIFVNMPLLYFRKHGGSSSFSITNIKEFFGAQVEFTDKVFPILNESNLKDDISENAFNLFRWCVRDSFSVVRKNKKIFPKSFLIHLFILCRLSIKNKGGLTRSCFFVVNYILKHVKKSLFH